MPTDEPRKDEGPSRETAATMLERRIVHLQLHLSGLSALLAVARKFDPGSAGEQAMYELLCQAHTLHV